MSVMTAAVLQCGVEQNPTNDFARFTEPAKIRTLIVDDQLMARELLRRMLKAEGDIEIVGMPASGPEAVKAINSLAPDLVFLDVRMPELDGFGVLAQIDAARMPIIIFVTANDDFALRAFDVHALDYLVKPCSLERLQQALRRARAQLRRNQTGEVQRRLTALLHDLKSQPKLADRLPVKSEGRIIFLGLSEIDWVEAADNYVKVHVGKQAHMLRQTMAVLESKLPPDRFLRISHSTLVNMEQIKELHPMFHGDYVVVLRNGVRLT